MIVVFWIVPILASALLIYILALILGAPADKLPIGKAVWTAFVLALINIICYFIIRPIIGRSFLLPAFCIDVVIVRGMIGLGFIRSAVLLIVYGAIASAFVHFVSNYHSG